MLTFSNMYNALMEYAMQKRYCTCGHSLWVFFITRQQHWKSVFFNGTCFAGIRVETCPHCGAPLDINSMR